LLLAVKTTMRERPYIRSRGRHLHLRPYALQCGAGRRSPSGSAARRPRPRRRTTHLTGRGTLVVPPHYSGR
jgi:hypothetical protein